MDYPLTQNPLIWLRRFRQRCGYGVHSPYAFSFITEVIYEKGMYYAYKDLDALLPWYVSSFALRPQKILRLFFRLSNFAEPREALFLGDNALAFAYLRAADERACWSTEPGTGNTSYDLIYIDKGLAADNKLPQGRMIVIDHLRQQKALWKKLKESEKTTLTFDLYDVGIVMQGLNLNRMDYVVNF